VAVRVPQFAMPLRVVNGDFAVVEQGSIEDIEQNVMAVLRTIVGSRIDAPDFGIPDETFEQLSASPSAEPYIAAVEAAEPRAHLIGEARIEKLVKRIVIERDRTRG
jgi:phage baseplate assembly protein W